MFILLVASTDSQETLETVHHLTQATVSRGHRVVVFFNSQSTRLLGSDRDSPHLPALSELGVRLLACRTSVLETGLAPKVALMNGVEMSSLGELVDLMADAERVLFLG
ncbi:DsrE family protein [Candidatus Bathyarchaeota archaeon]|nr:DsrE family protein [Candidatus Bathyarchaeota archaeon]